eukprot:CAMPEP_0197191228 /NCGR_PEP_ID=MMETSP1423-20130617/23006_1 /TAXON_ID=476441 /ORGANISM="Pseudo-nitzschia heimii, Strain UNC1101" /LENGTH=781 /DNA_ID=CAMNT_0042643801 /DNA_START=63 /DNA_END=2408 /DNA_ORIENTATION=-
MTGDSEAAMRLLISENKSGIEETPQQEYNCLLLSALATSTTTVSNSKKKLKSKNNGHGISTKECDISLLDESLEDARIIVLNSHSNNLRNRRATAEDWVLAYNRGLVLLSKGDIEGSIRESWSYLKPVIRANASSQQQQQPPLELACRMGFLILEGMLTLYPTRSDGKTSGEKDTEATKYEVDSSFDLTLLDKVLAWLRENVELTKAPSQSAAAAGNENQQEINATSTTSTSGTPDPQLKFLLSLYESRVNFFERTTGDTNIRDKHMRSARKELKHAMEIFQHKLRPERADTSSLASLSSFSEDVTAAAGGYPGGYRIEGKQSPVPSRATSPSPPSGGLSTKSNTHLSRILQGQNQAALNLKANAEQLKGNVKKSLVLCGEAQSYNSDTGNGNSNTYYDAIHQNNLGIVYESSGKSHLALHAFSKAVRCAIDNNKSSTNSNFDSDGTACPNVSLHVLNNAAVCALKSRNYSAAYQCYAMGLASSKSWRKRPRKWLRLSEACIGLNAKVQKERSETFSKCSKVEVDGKAKGIILTEMGRKYADNSVRKELPALSSPEDLKAIRDNALIRARMALKMALDLFGENSTDADELELQSARLSFAYVCLEEKDFKIALEYSMLVLNNTKADSLDSLAEEEDPAESARKTMIKRQVATARMYASEASASLGDPMASMKILVGDGKDDAFDRLSSDLGGVTIGMASTNSKAKSRLAKAQTMVRCSASAASASLGNLTASKQLAMSAQAMENCHMASRDGTSQARKALLYCMLREGNHGAALTLLRSSR